MDNKAEHIITMSPYKKVSEMKMLIVVDRYIPGKILKDKLEKLEYNIIGVCTSGQEALVRVREDKPSLILTDMELDNCSGIHLIQQFNTFKSCLSIYFTVYATDFVVQRTINIATTLGYNTSKFGNEKLHKHFESSFCQHHGIDPTANFIKSQTEQPIRVLLVDDQQIILWGLKKLIDNERPRMEVIGLATNIDDAKRIAEEKKPDIVILNIYLDNVECMHVIPDFATNGNARVVIFVETNNKEVIDRAVLNGARGVVHRKESIHTIIRAIEKIHNGELWLDRITTGRIFLQNSRMRGKAPVDADAEKITTLTRKECIILKAFSEGVGGEQNKQIAARLCMSEHTLRNHLTSIFSKLGIRNRFSLFTYAKKHFQQDSNSLNSINGSFKNL